MEEKSSSEILFLLGHMPVEDKRKFPRLGDLAFNFIKYGEFYRVSMGEFHKGKYVPYALRPMKQIPEGKTIEDIVADEIASLGEDIAYFTIFKNNSLYKEAITPFKMPYN